jgi:hypothetical protein
MPGLPLTGRRGAIQWGYYTAAAVLDYTVLAPDAHRPTWTLRATVPPGHADPYKLTQTPLEFIAPVKDAPGLRWPVLTITLEHGQLRATLGPLANLR